MSQQKTTKRQQFIDTFGRTPTSELEARDGVYTNTRFDGITIDDTETVMLMDSHRETFETINLTEYDPNSGWSMGYVEVDDGIQAVYTFEKGRIAINADKLDNVAQLRGETPADTADSVLTYRYFPVVVPWNEHSIVIAPILNADVADDKDGL